MRVPRFFLVGLAVVGLFAVHVAAAAQEGHFRAEVMEHVVDRCYTAAARYRIWRAGRDGHDVPLSVGAIVAELKRAGHTEPFIEKMMETVGDRDRLNRSRLYDIAFVECFLGSVEYE